MRVSSVSDWPLQKNGRWALQSRSFKRATKVCGLQNNTDRQYTIVLSQRCQQRKSWYGIGISSQGRQVDRFDGQVEQLRAKEQKFEPLPDLTKDKSPHSHRLSLIHAVPLPLFTCPDRSLLLRFLGRSVATESAMPPLKVSSQTRGGSFEKPCGCIFQPI